jgi:hypothetical protein
VAVTSDHWHAWLGRKHIAEAQILPMLLLRDIVLGCINIEAYQ